MSLAIIERYAAGGPLLAYAASGLSPEYETARPGPGAWSIAQLVAHLLDADLVYAERMKRVIAEEGDTVRVVDGRVYVNDVPIPDEQVPPEYRSHDDWGPQVIPEGYYFVMGDHRNNSSDSRHWGFVPKKYIIGKVQLRWWPVPTATIF